jgi:putative phosphoribosyl transferase
MTRHRWRKDTAMFRDRKEAGERLAALLGHLWRDDPAVLALPRGGVAIGAVVARALGAPLDVVLVRKIGVPRQPELALGAVCEPAAATAGGAEPEIFIDRGMAEALAVPEHYIVEETARQSAEIARRRQLYCTARPPLEIAGKTAIVVDDGIATGATMRVALRAVRRRGPRRLVLAAPVAAPETLETLQAEADETVCLATPPGLGAIGYYYGDFHQLDDAEVIALLAAAAAYA